MTENPVSVAVEKAFDSKDRDALLLKFSSKIFEVNVYVEIERLGNLLSFFKNNDDYCLAGKSAKDNVYWAREDDASVHLLIGHDLDTWDIRILVDGYAIDNLLAEICAIIPAPSLGKP